MRIKSYNEINIYNRYLEYKNDKGIVSIPLLKIEGKPQEIIINDDYCIIFDYKSNLVHHINSKLNYKSTDPIFFIDHNTQEIHNYDKTSYNKNNIVQIDGTKKEIFIKYAPIATEPLPKSKLFFQKNEISIQIQRGKYEIIIQFIENNKFYEQRNKVIITEINHNMIIPILYYDYYAIIIEYENIEEKHIIYGTLENPYGKYFLNLNNNILYHPQNPYNFMVKIIKVYLHSQQDIYNFILYINKKHTPLNFYELFIDEGITLIKEILLIETIVKLHIQYKINNENIQLNEYELPMNKPSYFWENYYDGEEKINYLNHNNTIPINPPNNYNENRTNWLNRLIKNDCCIKCNQINYCQSLMPTINKKMASYKNCFWK